jgi:hypothetical protein
MSCSLTLLYNVHVVKMLVTFSKIVMVNAESIEQIGAPAP